MTEEPGKGSLYDKSDEGVIAEWYFWNDKVINARSWGAGLAAAAEFREDAERELRRRGLALPLEK